MIVFGNKQVSLWKAYDHINELYMICMLSDIDAVANEGAVLTEDKYNNSVKLYFTKPELRNKVFKSLKL